MDEISRIINIIDEFLEIPATIGYEIPFLDYLNKKISKLGYKTTLNPDYLHIKSKKSKAKYIFSVHIDRHGLIKNKENELEYAAFYWKKKKQLQFKREEVEQLEEEFIENLNLSQIEFKANLVGDLLRFTNHEGLDLKFTRQGTTDFFEKVALRHVKEDISSYNPITGKIINTLTTKRYNLDIKNKLITYDIDLKLKPEDMVFMLHSRIEQNQNLISAQLDNVISAAVLYYILETTQFNQEIIFTTKEEIGQSYLGVIEYLKNKKDLKLIVLDTSPYSDFKGKKDGFLTLRYGDENGGFNSELVENIKKTLEKEEISYDFKPDYMGRTELGRISTETKGKINGTTLQIPTLNYHTTYETTTIESLENYLKIIKKLNL